MHVMSVPGGDPVVSQTLGELFVHQGDPFMGDRHVINGSLGEGRLVEQGLSHQQRCMIPFGPMFSFLQDPTVCPH